MTLSFDLWSWKAWFLEIFFSHAKLKNMITIFQYVIWRIGYLQYPKSHCDVTDDVIVVKIVSFYTTCHLFFIAEVNLWRYTEDGFLFLKTVSIFVFRLSLKQKPKHIDIRELPIPIIFVSTLFDQNWQSYVFFFKIWPTFWHGDVIDDVMSAWHITCPLN